MKYQRVPTQTTSGSTCVQLCPPGETYKEELSACKTCGKMFKFKYLPTCARTNADDMCLARDESDPENINKLINGQLPNRVLMKPCQLKQLGMSAGQTQAHTNQIWLKRKFLVETPAAPGTTDRPTQEEFFTMTIPVKFFIQTKLVKPSPDYVPVADQEYCLTASANGATGAATGALEVQVCEYKKANSQLRELQLFKFDSVSCADDEGTNAFRTTDFISLKATKTLLTADTTTSEAKFTTAESTVKEDRNKWTSFEEKLLPVC